MATSNSRGRRARLSLRTILRGWPWYYETTSVHSDEILLRAIPNAPGYFSEEMGSWKVNPYNFVPRKSDTDGLSFFREDFVTAHELVKKNSYVSGVRVGRITVQQLAELGLSAEAFPDAMQPAGHVVVPGLRFVEKHLQSKEEKQKLKDLQQRLAQFATKNYIYTPRGLPATDVTSTRS